MAFRNRAIKKLALCLPRKFPDSGKTLSDGEMKCLVENEAKQVFGKTLMFRATLAFILCLKLQPVVVYLLIKTEPVSGGGQLGSVRGSERVPTS